MGRRCGVRGSTIFSVVDELGDLRLFTRIVAAGSLSEAARRGHSSLASVSRRLAALEDRLGVRLVDRGSRRFTLTDEGRLLHARAMPIVEALDAATAELTAAARPPQGLLRVSAPNQIGRRQIARLCQAFVQEHPQVRIELSLSDARPDILEQDLDIAIQTKRPTQGEVICRRLLSSRRVVCAAPAYLARRGRPAQPRDLAGHDCLCVVRAGRLYDRWMFEGADGPATIAVSGPLVSDSTDTLQRWALDGAGVVIKALWDVEEDLAAGRLVELLAEYACDDIHLYATLPSRRHTPPRVRAFLDFIALELASGASQSPS
jgi:DNA-binding transcriptional LysR family regulator